MKFDFNIKTFLRVDDSMLETLLPLVNLGYHYKDHWVVWMIAADKVTPEVEEWLRHQPDDAHDICRHIGFIDGIKSCPVDEVGYITYLTIGVSLSAVDRDQIYRMKQHGRLSIIEADTTRPGFDATKNPHLFTQASMGFVYTPRFAKPLADFVLVDKKVNPELEEKFLASLDGHDFYYDYSDSLSVWKRGEAATKRLKDAGIEMGLSKADVDRLYLLKCKELTKR